jgi:hypothetical protein
MWADLSVDPAVVAGNYVVKIGDLTLNVAVSSKLLGKPVVPLYVGMASWGLVLGHGLPNTTGVGTQGPLTKKHVDLFHAHRIELSGQFITQPPIKADGTMDIDNWSTLGGSFRQLVIDGAVAPVCLSNPSNIGSGWLSAAQLQAWEKTMQANPALFAGAWDYTTDEPGDLAGVATRMQLIRANNPSVKTMVTTGPNTTTGSLIDIYTPVMNFLTKYLAGSWQWDYVSCMSHGACSGTTPAAGTGIPDLMLDQPSYHALMFPVVSMAMGAKGMLYYSANQAFGRLDVWKTQYDFAGNGDGTLVLPCGPNAGPAGACAVDTAVPTIRMKLLRDGLTLGEKLKDAGKLGSAVRSTTDWEKNYDVLNSLLP